MRGRTNLLAGRALLLLASVVITADRGFAQAPAAPASLAATTAFVSTSGAITFGFTKDRESIESSGRIDIASILPAGSDIPPVARSLVEKMWRRSPTFRRQCARLTEGRVAVVLSFDFSRHTVQTNAESVITRKAGLRAHIHMRGADPSATEYLAHEIEHVLEQIDEVDLKVAVATHMDGARLVRRPDAFETSRAIAMGRLVAREVEASQDRR